MTAAGGTTIALAVRRSRRRVVGHFCALHALSAPDAVQYVPDLPMDARAFAALRALGIVHEAQPGLFWIDLIALKADEDRHGGRFAFAALVVALLAAFGIMSLWLI